MTKAKLAELRECWHARIAEFRASGQPGAAWGAVRQIKEHQLWYWIGKLKEEATSYVEEDIRAVVEAVRLMRSVVGDRLCVKASGCRRRCLGLVARGEML